MYSSLSFLHSQSHLVKIKYFQLLIIRLGTITRYAFFEKYVYSFGKLLNTMHILKWHMCLSGMWRLLQHVSQDEKSLLSLVSYHIIKNFKHTLMKLNKVKELSFKRHHRLEVKKKKELTKQEAKLQNTSQKNYLMRQLTKKNEMRRKTC